MSLRGWGGVVQNTLITPRGDRGCSFPVHPRFWGDDDFSETGAVVSFHPFRMKNRADLCDASICDPPKTSDEPSFPPDRLLAEHSSRNLQQSLIYCNQTSKQQKQELTFCQQSSKRFQQSLKCFQQSMKCCQQSLPCFQQSMTCWQPSLKCFQQARKCCQQSEIGQRQRFLPR